MPKKAVRAAVRMALLSKFQDGQAVIINGLSIGEKPRTKVVVNALRAIRRPDLTEDAATEVVGESKAVARDRTLDGRTILLGTPALDPLLYRSARNIEGVQVAPVADFNTYDVLKQRYLVLTPEALTALKEKVKAKVNRRPKPQATAAAAAGQES